MYDWIRREDTRFLLHHSTPKAASTTPQSQSSRKQVRTDSKKQPEQSLFNRSSSINECLRHNNTIQHSAYSSNNKQPPQSRQNRTFSHQCIFNSSDDPRITTTTTTQQVGGTPTEKQAITTTTTPTMRTSSTYKSDNMKQIHSHSVVDTHHLSPPKSSKPKHNNQIASTQQINILAHDYQTNEQSKQTPIHILTTRNRNTPQDSILFLPSTPKQSRINQFKLKDHSISDLFGDDTPRGSTPHETMAQNSDLTSQKNFNKPQKVSSVEFPIELNQANNSHPKSTKNLKSSDQSNISLSSVSHASLKVKNQQLLAKKSLKILENVDNFLASSDHHRSRTTAKSAQKEQQDQVTNAFNRTTSLNKLESNNDKGQSFLNNRKFVEQQRLKQIKSNLFDEINSQIFGGSIVTQEQISLPSKEQVKQQQQQQPQQQAWLYDRTNESQRRQDYLFSDLFASENSAALRERRDSNTLTTASSLSSSKNKHSNSSSNSETQAATTCDSRFYSNLSSALDAKGYQNNIKRDGAYKIEANMKFEKNILIARESKEEEQRQMEMQHLNRCSIKASKRSRENQSNQQSQQSAAAVVELDLSNFSENFDKKAFETHCATNGIHLVDISFEYNKINQQCRGSGSVKIRGCDVDSARLLEIKQYLRNQGLVVSNRSTQKNSSESNAITLLKSAGSGGKKQTGGRKMESNNKNWDSKRRSVTIDQGVAVTGQSEMKRLQEKKNSCCDSNIYACRPNEIDTAKKLVEQLKWNSTINLVTKQSNLKKELNAKKITLAKNRSQTPSGAVVVSHC